MRYKHLGLRMHMLWWVLGNPIPSYLTHPKIEQHFVMLELALKWVERGFDLINLEGCIA